MNRTAGQTGPNAPVGRKAGRSVARQVRERVRTVIQERSLLEPGQTVVVGLSGGPDSLCLAHVLRDMGWAVHLAHLDHGLRGDEAQGDAAFVRSLAERWGVGRTLERVDVRRVAADERLSVEEAARQERYRFLAKVAHDVGAAAVAVGHQADDQVETVLMHFLRGAGLSGLRGMRHRSLRLGVPLIRPLLDIERSEILAYLGEVGLEPRFDRSNLDTTFFRNRLRHELIPQLETYNPHFRQVVRRSSASLREDYAFLRRAVLRAQRRLVTSSQGAYRLDRRGFLALPPALQSHLLRRLVFLAGARLRDFGHEASRRARQALRRGRGELPLPGGLRLWVLAGEAWIGRELPEPDWPFVSEPVRLEVPGSAPLDGGWRARAEWRPAAEATFADGVPAWEAWLDPSAGQGTVWLRPRQPGDRFQPLGMSGHKSLQEFMVDERIPRPWRDRLPLLVRDDEVLWVAGWRISERVRLKPASDRALWIRLGRSATPDGEPDTPARRDQERHVRGGRDEPRPPPARRDDPERRQA